MSQELLEKYFEPLPHGEELRLDDVSDEDVSGSQSPSAKL